MSAMDLCMTPRSLSSSSSSSSSSSVLVSPRVPSSPACVASSFAFLASFSPLRAVFLSSDLKFSIFDYLFLREIQALVLCCRFLSVSHFTFRYKLYHPVDFARLREVIRNYQTLYECYVQKSKLNCVEGEMIPWSAPGCPESITSTSVSSICSTAFTSSRYSPSCLSSLRPSSFVALCSFQFFFLKNVDELSDSCTLPIILQAKIIHFHRRFFGAIPPNALYRSSIQEMYFNAYFNRPLPKNSLPASLKVLDLGGRFDSKLETSSLPAGVEELFLTNYKQPLDAGVLPAQLKKLHLGDSTHSQLLTVGSLPASLEHLHLGVEWNHALQVDVLPCDLKVLRFDDCSRYNHKFLIGTLPSSLVELYLGDAYNRSFDSGVLPASLRKLVFAPSAKFNRSFSLGSLPPSIEELVLGHDFNCSLSSSVLPSSLRRLVFGAAFNRSLPPGALPSGLVELDLGSRYDHPLEEHVLPQSLRRLKLSTAFNSLIEPGALPARLAELTLGAQFNRKLDFLPQSLRILKVGEQFKQSVECALLPGTLMNLHLHSSAQSRLLCGMLPWNLKLSYSVYIGRRRSDAQIFASVNGDSHLPEPLHMDGGRRRSDVEAEEKVQAILMDKVTRKRRSSMPNTAAVADSSWLE